MKQIKVVELFAGVGGFHLGLTMASNQYSVVWANQFEPYFKKQFAYDIYKKNFPNTPISNEDITKFDKNKIPTMDLLVAGFPCQDYSVANTNTKGIEGKKGALWWDIYEVAKLKIPKYILLENVDRLLVSPKMNSKNTGRDFGIILKTLSSLGYGVCWKMVNSGDYGYPQRRKRLFIFGFRKDTKFYQDLLNVKDNETEFFLKSMPPFSSTLENEKLQNFEIIDLLNTKNIKEFSDCFYLKKGFRKTGYMIDDKVVMSDYIPKARKEMALREIILQNVEDEEFYLTPEKIIKFKELKGGSKIERTTKTGFEYKYSIGKMDFPDCIDKSARTIITSEGTVSRTSHVIKDLGNNRLRFITPLETERINTFPDNWTECSGVTKSNRYFVMGNALVVKLIKEIGEQILKIIEKRGKENE